MGSSTSKERMGQILQVQWQKVQKIVLTLNSIYELFKETFEYKELLFTFIKIMLDKFVYIHDIRMCIKILQTLNSAIYTSSSVY